MFVKYHFILSESAVKCQEQTGWCLGLRMASVYFHPGCMSNQDIAVCVWGGDVCGTTMHQRPSVCCVGQTELIPKPYWEVSASCAPVTLFLRRKARRRPAGTKASCTFRSSARACRDHHLLPRADHVCEAWCEVGIIQANSLRLGNLQCRDSVGTCSTCRSLWSSLQQALTVKQRVFNCHLNCGKVDTS